MDQPNRAHYAALGSSMAPPALAFIDGALCPAQGGRVFENISPANGRPFGTMAFCQPDDVDRAGRAPRL